MDDDKIDITAPTNRPHEFLPGGLQGRTPTICAYGFPVVCGRGSGHHVHDVPAEPSGYVVQPHEYVPEFDLTNNGTCTACKRDKDDIVHDALEPAYARPGHVRASDPVNQPAHYTAHPSGVECIQITEHMSFNLGNAVKYIWRADLKGDAITDLEKARWYLEREITRRTQE